MSAQLRRLVAGTLLSLNAAVVLDDMQVVVGGKPDSAFPSF